MSENFKPGDMVRCVQFDYTDFQVIRLTDTGQVGCRYRSYGKNEEYVLHYVEFEPWEIRLKDSRQ